MSCTEIPNWKMNWVLTKRRRKKEKSIGWVWKEQPSMGKRALANGWLCRNNLKVIFLLCSPNSQGRRNCKSLESADANWSHFLILAWAKTTCPRTGQWVWVPPNWAHYLFVEKGMWEWPTCHMQARVICRHVSCADGIMQRLNWKVHLSSHSDFVQCALAIGNPTWGDTQLQIHFPRQNGNHFEWWW